MNVAKPDNRKNNVERLQEMKENTKHNIEAAEETLQNDDLPEKEKEQIRAKNERRRQSIRAFESEIKDEMEARRRGEV